jgi:hypothetical protein
MPRPFIRLARFTGRLGLTLGAIVGLVGLFLALIVLTEGAGSGLAAWLMTFGVGAAAAIWRARAVRDRAHSCRAAVPGIPGPRKREPGMPGMVLWSADLIRPQHSLPHGVAVGVGRRGA